MFPAKKKQDDVVDNLAQIINQLVIHLTNIKYVSCAQYGKKKHEHVCKLRGISQWVKYILLANVY